MEAILDLQDSSPFELFHFGHLRPFRADLVLNGQQHGVLSLGPLTLIYIRLEHVNPSLTTLSSHSLWQELGYPHPIFGA